MNTKNQRGFTLVEVMIVVAIVAILAAIAYPSYLQFVKRSDRASAKSLLLEDAQFMERNLTLSNSYALDGSGAAITVDSLPAAQSPRDGTAKYVIAFQPGSLTTSKFTLTATPTGTQTGDECGTFTLNEQGKKNLSAATATVQDCWNR